MVVNYHSSITVSKIVLGKTSAGAWSVLGALGMLAVVLAAVNMLLRTRMAMSKTTVIGLV
jgi:hypothetical protein